MLAHADDYIPPELIRISTPLYRASAAEFEPKLGTYEYTVGWESIPAASCAVRISRDGDNLIIDAAARTYSAVDLLYKLRYEAIGTISASTFLPVNLTINHRENSRTKTIDMAFAPEGGEITAVRAKGADDPNKKIVSFTPHNRVLDPIGAGFLARSLSWTVGETKEFDVFNGKSRYYLALKAVERTTIEHLGRQWKVIVISPFVRNLTTTRPVSKLREAKIYITDDRDRDVLKITSSVFIGSVNTQLASFTPEVLQRTPLVTAAHAANDDSVRAQMR
jgi:hypothetical protein